MTLCLHMPLVDGRPHRCYGQVLRVTTVSLAMTGALTKRSATLRSRCSKPAFMLYNVAGLVSNMTLTTSAVMTLYLLHEVASWAFTVWPAISGFTCNGPHAH